MSIILETFRGASWLAVFKALSQLFSWIVTILVARMLVPTDYGLYAMAFMITGYAEMFNQMGLGAAIIQKKDINQIKLSSVFWFSLSISLIFAIACIPISYITAYIFNEKLVINLTQSVAVLFILSGLQIIPLALLRRDLQFKIVGQIELIATIIAGVSMLAIAYYGGGVWALVGGRIVRSLTMALSAYAFTKWYPNLHFKFVEAKEYIKYGITVAGGGSLFYITENVDKFFAGRSWNSSQLGLYSFALELAKLPTDKIVTLINQVSFPAFSKVQDDERQFKNLYIKVIKIISTLVFPLFVGGFILGHDLINVLLGEKWAPISLLFEWLCLSQIITSLNSINNFVHNARGNPRYSLAYNFVGAIVMSISFYVAVKYGVNAILIPWFSSYFILSSVWIMFTIKEIDIKRIEYLRVIMAPMIGAIVMGLAITLIGNNLINILHLRNEIVGLSVKILIAIVAYSLFIWLFDRKLLISIWGVIRNKSIDYKNNPSKEM